MPTPTPSTALRAVVHAAPTGPRERFDVVLDEDRASGIPTTIDHWSPHGSLLPQPGDRCLVVPDDEGRMWLSEWEPQEDTTAGVSASDLRRGVFSAYRATALSVPASTVVIFDGTEFNPDGWYDPALGLYMPQLAGYYRLSWRLLAGEALTGTQFWSSVLVKNGTGHKGGSIGTISASFPSSIGTAVVYASGSDAFSVRTSTDRAGGTVLTTSAATTFFQGERISS